MLEDFLVKSSQQWIGRHCHINNVVKKTILRIYKLELEMNVTILFISKFQREFINRFKYCQVPKSLQIKQLINNFDQLTEKNKLTLIIAVAFSNFFTQHNKASDLL